MGNFSALGNQMALMPSSLAVARPDPPAENPSVANAPQAAEKPLTPPQPAPTALGQQDQLAVAASPTRPLPASPFRMGPARRQVTATALSRSVGVAPMAAAPSVPVAAKPEKKGFFDMILSVLKAILDLLLAPIRWLLGLFGVGSSGKAKNDKLTEVEQTQGRKVSLMGTSPDTGAFGPFGVKHYKIKMPTRDGRGTDAEVYIPQGQGPFPSLIHAYGLFGSIDKHKGTASHYASWGLITIVPDLPHGSDNPGANAPEIADWVQWIQSHPPELPHNLSTERGVGLSGHSFGGLTSVLAGSSPGVAAVVALDPADSSGLGKQAAGQLKVPSAFIMGERSLVNQFGNGNDIYDAAGGDKELIKVRGAQHTDFENSHTDGAKNAANETAMRFATGFMLYQLTGKPEYAAYAKGGAEVQAETASKLIETR